MSSLFLFIFQGMLKNNNLALNLICIFLMFYSSFFIIIEKGLNQLRPSPREGKKRYFN